MKRGAFRPINSHPSAPKEAENAVVRDELGWHGKKL